ncbi:MAG: LysR family transcriptional regulator [Firmicutes bacterium]|nr:LysR family transcriptional regulator [Bacillota bacterium]
MLISSFDNININSLRNFVTVAEIGNITKAAEEVYLTQPSLSRQLVQLENTFEEKLFSRSRDGVKLTAEGEIVYKQCRNLLHAYDEFASTILGLKGAVSGTLTIAHQKNLATLILHIHKTFLKSYPNVNISNYRQGRQNYLDLLLSGRLDAAYLPTLELTHAPDQLKSFPIITKRNMLLVSVDNPIAKRDRIHLAELANEPFVLPNKQTAPNLLKQIIDTCEANGFTPHAVGYADNYVDYEMDIVRFDAVSIHPFMHNVEDSHLVKYVALDGFPEEYPISLVWNSASTHPLLSLYVDAVRDFVRQHDALIQSLVLPRPL